MVKKVICLMVGAAFVVALSGIAFSSDATVTKTKDVTKTAAGTDTIKVKTTTTADKTVEKTKEKIKTPEGTTKIKETVTQTNTTKEDTAKVVKHFKEGDVAKEKVTFRSYTDENGGTLIIVKDQKEMRYPAKNYKDWKHNVLAKKETEIIIHKQWDPKLNADVVIGVEEVK